MTRKWFGWRLGCILVFAVTLISAAKPPASGGQKETPTPNFGDPAIYWWYKNDTPYVGKEINKIAINVGEEIPVCVQALDANARDIGVCPVEWKADNTVLTITPIAGKCNAVKIKGLKNAEASLIAVFVGSKKQKIEAALKGYVGPPPAQPQSSPKASPPSTNKQQPSKNKPK
jgi:hypothetical protein